MKSTLNLFFTLSIIAILSACSGKSGKEDFSYSLIPVQSDEKWGYIDKDGKYVVNPQFKEAFLFSDGLALVKTSDEKYGYITEDGKILINAVYKGATCFSEELAFVTKENGFINCIDTKGDLKFELKDAEQAMGFSEGLAPVRIKEKWGFIDKEGKIVINPQFEDVGSFSEGLAPISQKKDKDSKDMIWGYIDKEGKILINPQFATASIFKNGRAIVGDGKKSGYIDNKGLYIINPQFDEARLFSDDGLAAIKQGDNWGYINQEGKIVINPQFENCQSFKGGLAPVSSGKENWGYIDKEGKYVVNPQFKQAAKFYFDYAPVLSGDKYGFIDKQGKFTINPQFSALTNYSDYNKLETWPLKYSYIESDYLDASLVFKPIFDEKNELFFANVGPNTTLSNLIDAPKNKDRLKADGKYYVTKSGDFEMSTEVSLKTLKYAFRDPIYNVVTNYFYGYATGDEKKYNYNVLVSGIEYELDLNIFTRANNKANTLADGLKSYLMQNFGAKEGNIENEPFSELEEKAKQTADSIASALSVTESTSDKSEKKSENNISKVYTLSSKKYNFVIRTDGYNTLMFKVVFNNTTNS